MNLSQPVVRHRQVLLLRLAWLLLTLGLFAACKPSTKEPTPSNGTPQSSTAAPLTTTMTAAETGDYELGKVVRFGTGGGSERFRVSGWNATEKDATWTSGETAKLLFPIARSDQPLSLQMRLASLSGVLQTANASAQPVEVFVNGQKVADWNVSAAADFAARIPVELVRDGGHLAIDLKTLKAASPKSLGIGEDARVLGVFCFSFVLTKGI